MGKNVTVAQVMEIKKMADEKGVGREAFKGLYAEFSRVLDNAKYDIIAAIENGRTELWLHSDQENGYANGRNILRRLIDDGLLAGCLDLAEAKEIQAQGITFWRKYFAGKYLPAWRSVEDDDVWCLCGRGGGLVLGRRWVGSSFSSSGPALRRK